MALFTWNKSNDVTAPAMNALAVTKSDTVDLPNAARGLYIGGAGDVTATMAGSGNDVVFVGLAAGTVLPVSVTRVKNATTATSIVALW